MVGNWLKYTLLLLLGMIAVLSTSVPVKAQESDSLIGFWKQKGASVYIQISETDGVINAEMIRNDWAPGLVSQNIFQNLTPGKKNRWTGDALLVGSDEMGTVSVSMKDGQELTTKVKPGRTKKIKWSRSEAMEKRY
jgi:hypothetical protein